MNQVAWWVSTPVTWSTSHGVPRTRFFRSLSFWVAEIAIVTCGPWSWSPWLSSAPTAAWMRSRSDSKSYSSSNLPGALSMNSTCRGGAAMIGSA